MSRRLCVGSCLGAAILAASLLLLISPRGSAEGEKLTKEDARKEAGKSQTADRLPIAQVVLFSSGVGYFQREGQVDGDERIDLTFPTSDINDLIKSMTLRDVDGGRVAAVSFDGNAPIERTLRSFAINLTNEPTFGAILNQARGEKVEVVLQQTNATQPGTVTGAIIGIEDKQQQVGQTVLKTECLNLWCADGMRSFKLGDVQRIRFLNPIMESEFKKALETVALSHDTQKRAVSLHFAGQGKRGIKVGYVIENPIWKTSYRLVLPPEKKEKPFLQGWAVVENVTDEDWNDVKMALISGRPISFQMNLYDALFIKRPVVEPELFASLRPPTYSGAMEGRELERLKLIRDHQRLTARTEMDRAEKLMEQVDAKRMRELSSKPMADSNMATNGALGAVDFEKRMDLRQGVHSPVHVERLGDYFQYVVDHPVSLPRQKSALLPIVTKEVEGERVSIYNEGTHAKFPLLGLVFKNTTGTHLSQGPITVFEGATYAGDARILDLQKNEQRLLSYAIDLGTEVQTIPHSDNGKITSVKIVKGIVYTKTKLQESKTYKVVNRNEDNRIVMLEHPNRTDFSFTSKDKPWETARDVHRFRIEVPAGKTIDHVVAEEKVFGSEVSITNSNDQSIRLLLNEKVTSDAVKDALRKALEYRGKLAETQRELEQVQRKLADIEKDQDRLRKNLREMPPTAEAYKRYLKKFDEQETEIEQYQASIKKMQDQEHAQRKEYESWLAVLSVE